MENFTVRLTPLLLLAATALLACEAAAAPKTSVAPPPPQPVEQRVSVKRGGAVDVPLRIYGTRAQTLSWDIRQPPARGKLSNLRATAPEAGAVTYTPPADLRIVSERFTFSARSNEGVSAAAEVLVSIADDDPQLVLPADLDFGSLLTGARKTEVIEFTNGGGGIAQGTIKVDEPWLVEGAREYKLAAGGRHVAKIVFAPGKAGAFDGEVRFSSQPDRVIAVRGAAGDALAVKPGALTLTHDPGMPLRAGVFELRNNTDAPLAVAIAAGRRLIVSTPIQLAAHSATPVSVQTSEKDTAALDETIRFTAGAVAAELPVKAGALPAMVIARSASVAFRRSGAKERVIVENTGGVAASVTLSIAPPFAIEGEKAFAIDAGAAHDVVLAVAAGWRGAAQSALKIATVASALEVPVTADISENAVAASHPNPPAPIPRAEPRDEEPEILPSAALPATIVSVGQTSVTFQWPGEPPAGAALRCLVRTISLDQNGEPAAGFQDYPAVKFERRDDANFATVERLDPDTSYVFRVDATDPGTHAASPLTFAQIRTLVRPSRLPHLPLVPVLFLLALLTGGISIWQRSRNTSGF